MTSSLEGGGGLRLNGSGKVRNCLIANNTASGGRGGGVWGNVLSSPAAWIQSCTIVGNVADNIGGVYRNNAWSGHVVYNSIVTSNANGELRGLTADRFTYSCCPDLNDGAAGNITAGPKFADFAAGDYTLQRGSPCINTGSNQTWMSSAHDLSGQPRLTSGTVDMGCYEYQPTGTAIMVQ